MPPKKSKTGKRKPTEITTTIGKTEENLAEKIDTRWKQLQTYLIQLEELESLPERNKIHTQATKLWNLINQDIEQIQTLLDPTNSSNQKSPKINKKNSDGKKKITSCEQNHSDISPEDLLHQIKDLSQEIQPSKLNFTLAYQYHQQLEKLQTKADIWCQEKKFTIENLS